MTVSFGTIHLWSRCPASAAPAASDRSQRLLNDSAREAMAARYVVESLTEGTISHASELVGRVVRGGGEVTEEIANDAAQFFADMKGAGFVPARADVSTHNEAESITGVTAWVRGNCVARMNYSWRYERPENDIRLLLACQLLATAEPPQLYLFQPRASRALPWSSVASSWERVDAAYSAVCSAALATWAGHDVAQAGQHCTYCPHRVDCAELAREIDAEFDRPPGVYAGGHIPAAMLGAELTHARHVAAISKARAEALEAEVRARITEEYIEGWAQEDLTERQWSVDPITAEFALGISLRKEVIISPAQAEKLGASKAAVAQLVTHHTTGTRLVKHDSKRIAKLFKGKGK